jgi:hypothetical protein
MAKYSDQPLDAKTLASIKASAKRAASLLGVAEQLEDPKAVVRAIDVFVFQWQKGKRPSPETLAPADAPLLAGSLWGDQLIKRFGWVWATVTFHERNNACVSAVVSPDRSLVVYPILFLTGCFQNPAIDGTIALSYNMLEAKKIGKMKPRQYFNLMEGVQRITPRA